MKVKNKSVLLREKKIKSKSKLVGEDGFPHPKKTTCFKCQNVFFIKFVIPRKDYSQKNNWDYWTGNKKDKNKAICDNCLLDFYYNKPLYWEIVKDLKKRQQFRTYIYHGVIST